MAIQHAGSLLVALLVVGTACCSAAPANVNVTGYGRIQAPSDTVSVRGLPSRLQPGSLLDHESAHCHLPAACMQEGPHRGAFTPGCCQHCVAALSEAGAQNEQRT